MKKTAQIHSTTQKFTEIVDISENVVILSGGNACLVIEITAMNFELLSQEEQDAKIYAYSSLLNSLSFPIQVIVRSKRLDITAYLRQLDTQEKASQNPLLSEQIRLYRDFVQELVKVNTVLDKRFYIIIAYSYLESGAAAASKITDKNLSQNPSFVTNAKASLQTKAQSLHSQLARLGLKAATLEREELIKLFYEIYNDSSIETNQVDENLRTPFVKMEQKK
jgi:hypothetical protein